MSAELFNVHQAISDAQFEKQNGSGEMMPISFRITLPVKKAVVEICDRNGITISDFLRHCCEGLVNDFGGPRENS